MKTPEERSPFSLMQEDYRGDAWRICVISILFGVSDSEKTKPIIVEFFSRYPDPRTAGFAPANELELLFKPIGLQVIKTERVQILSRRMLHEWKTVEDLP
jgi:endonuclease III